jgi:hypothetical protein
VNSRSLYYANKLGLNFISCEPFKVPLARLIVAQAHIDESAVSKRFELGPEILVVDEENKMDEGKPDDWVVFF